MEGRDSALVEALRESRSKDLRLIHAIGVLEESGENYQAEIARRMPGKKSKNEKWIKRNWGGLGELIELETEGEQEINWYSLTDKGKKVYQATKPLFTNAEAIQSFTEEFRSRTLRWPDRNEIESNIGRKLEKSEISYIRRNGWKPPSEELKKSKAKELLEICVWIVVKKEDVVSGKKYATYFQEDERRSLTRSGDFEPERVQQPGNLDDYMERNQSLIENFVIEEDDRGFLEVRAPDELASIIGGRFWLVNG